VVDNMAVVGSVACAPPRTILLSAPSASDSLLGFGRGGSSVYQPSVVIDCQQLIAHAESQVFSRE